MIAHLEPNVAFQFHFRTSAQSRARIAGLGLAAAVHGALIIWLLSQTFHPLNLDNTPTPPPMTVQTIDLTPPQPAPTPTPSTDVHQSTSTTTDQRVETLPVKVANATPTSQVAINPFVSPGTGGAITLTPLTLPHTLTNPAWISRPTADQVAHVYPEGAIRQGLAGQVMLNCQVTAAGAVAGCTVESETPSARGFGRAALSLTPYFRIRPGTDNGEPIEGASVQIPIRFKISG
jgi:protein TonB